MVLILLFIIIIIKDIKMNKFLFSIANFYTIHANNMFMKLDGRRAIIIILNLLKEELIFKNYVSLLKKSNKFRINNRKSNS